MQFVSTKIQHHRWPSSFARCSLAYILSIWVFQIWLEIWKVPRNSLTPKDFCIVWGFIAIYNFSERGVMPQMVSWISHYHLVWTREQRSVTDTLLSINYNWSGPLNNILSAPLCPCLVSRPGTSLFTIIQMTAVFTGGVSYKTCFTGDQMSWARWQKKLRELTLYLVDTRVLDLTIFVVNQYWKWDWSKPSTEQNKLLGSCGLLT